MKYKAASPFEQAPKADVLTNYIVHSNTLRTFLQQTGDSGLETFPFRMTTEV